MMTMDLLDKQADETKKMPVEEKLEAAEDKMVEGKTTDGKKTAELTPTEDKKEEEEPKMKGVDDEPSKEEKLPAEEEEAGSHKEKSATEEEEDDNKMDLEENKTAATEEPKSTADKPKDEKTSGENPEEEKKEEEGDDSKEPKQDDEKPDMKKKEGKTASPVAKKEEKPKTNKDDKRTMPCRFRSAFILFSSIRHKAIRAELTKQGKTERTATIAKTVSVDWRSMEKDAKKVWEDKARDDKIRYEREMEDYMTAVKESGGVTAQLPKRPMSAYLAYSNKRRAALKRLYPSATNAELSKMLSKAWKEAAPEVKGEYLEEEARLRAQYNIDMIPWRHNKKKPRTKKSTAAKKALKNKQQQTATKNFSDFNDLPPNLGDILNQQPQQQQQQQQPVQQQWAGQTMLGAMQGVPQLTNQVLLQQQQQQQQQRASLLGDNSGLGAYGQFQPPAMAGFGGAAQAGLFLPGLFQAGSGMTLGGGGGADLLGGYMPGFGGGGGGAAATDQQLLLQQLRNQQQQQQLLALQQQQQQNHAQQQQQQAEMDGLSQQQADARDQNLLQQALMAQQQQQFGGLPAGYETSQQ